MLRRLRASRAPRVLADFRPFMGVLGAHLGEGPPGDARSARLPSPPLSTEMNVPLLKFFVEVDQQLTFLCYFCKYCLVHCRWICIVMGLNDPDDSL
jgi:hypothetical protein